ncbi:TonB-dependent receptor family protein [Halomonas urumqiensis]|uniref:TonB-dependent receptor n=1 Tax=Halomonas urumqiensis TaxID=1684789 RepID=A0A2N7UMU1_9GAMM|nr:TonB-dependent receptor [Halomonas urumqiensis]PMR81747.1 TonB-dependent receptor [Halomonas urumqiensis]PTB02384.1 TonB-dependent receptor [Halomonas urumqiensis]GHE21867.1 TonB-dependent receptor [Halomonas urumqiensis]
MRHRLPTLCLTGLIVPVSWAQPEPTGDYAPPEAMPTITVTAPRLARDLYDTPAAVSALTREDIQQGQQGVRLDEALDRVPGVFLQNRDNFAQGQRISSRGFGARGTFGIRGLHIRVDGIPYTLPDGQAQIDAVDLDSAERIEVIRGPSSVLYGNAAGGVIDITTGDGSEMRRSPVLTLQQGSDGFHKLSVRNGGETGNWVHSVSVSALDFDGYREQSKVEKRLLNARVGYRLDDDRTLSALVNILDMPTAEDPSALTLEEVAEDRRQARDVAIPLDSGQRVEQQLVGLHYEDLDALGGEINIRGFASRRDFEQQLPFPGSSLIDYARNYYGGGADYTGERRVGDMPLRYVTGIDLARQEDDRGRRSVNARGEVTGITADEQQTATSAGIFLQTELGLTDTLELSAGVRHDQVRMDIDDRFIADGQDDSGRRTFREWTGSLGLSYRYQPDHQVYATLGNAFETPTFTEFARPDGRGGFNPEVQPQKALNREIGLRGIFDNGLGYELVAFSVAADDELIGFDAPNERTFYENAGETSRDGIEMGVDWSFSLAWRWTSALTLTDYRFDRFEDSGNDVAGNRLPGQPRQVWHNGLTWYGSGDRFATLEAQYTSDYYADNANEVTIDDHWLFNLKAGDSWRLGGGTTQLGANLGVRNLLDENYYENVRINSFGGRYYEPAAGRTFYAGLELSF